MKGSPPHVGLNGDLLASHSGTLHPHPQVCCCCYICFFFKKELVCSSARGHLILKTRLGKSNLISKGVSTGVEETGRVPRCGPEFSTPCEALNLQLLWWKERAMAEMNVQGICTGLICVHKWVGELSKWNCYFGLLLGYSYSTGNMFRKCFH